MRKATPTITYTPWQFEGRDLIEADIPEKAFAFIYRITFLPGKAGLYNYKGPFRYLGKKFLVNKTSRLAPAHKQLTKSGKPRKNPVKIRGTRITWQGYFGSSTELKELVQQYGTQCFLREIIQFTYSKRETSYYEDKHLMCQGVLEDYTYFNKNVGGSHYRKWLFPETLLANEQSNLLTKAA